MAQAFIAIGANLGHPPDQIAAALDALARVPESALVRSSAVYRSRPMGPADQPDYANAVAWIRTALEPLPLLDELLAIERCHGRVRAAGLRNGPRRLDLDLLLYDDRIVREPRLGVPHPGLHLRDFMLLPLLELAPQIVIPGVGPAAAWRTRCADHGLAPWVGAAAVAAEA